MWKDYEETEVDRRNAAVLAELDGREDRIKAQAQKAYVEDVLYWFIFVPVVVIVAILWFT